MYSQMDVSKKPFRIKISYETDQKVSEKRQEAPENTCILFDVKRISHQTKLNYPLRWLTILFSQDTNNMRAYVEQWWVRVRQSLGAEKMHGTHIHNIQRACVKA